MASSSKSEISYIRSSLSSNPPLRADGRTLQSYRPIAIETQVAPLANGSARINIGGATLNGAGGNLPGTEVIAAVKLEVETVGKGDFVDGGRIVCSVSCSPSAYPHMRELAIDDLQYDLTTIIQETLGHPSLHPQNLGILRGKKSWALYLDLLILSDNGNIYDALFLAAHAALRDTRIPKTRAIEFKARSKPTGSTSSSVDRLAQDVVMEDLDDRGKSGFDTRAINAVSDFELMDYWDEGEPLECGSNSSWPICITLNLLPPSCYLDATLSEEAATDIRLLVLFSTRDSIPGKSMLQGTRLLGPGEVDANFLKKMIPVAERYACELKKALDAKLQSEDARRSSGLKDKGKSR